MAETPKDSKPSKRTEALWSKNWFYITLVLVAVIGGGCAFILPYHVQREGDNIWSLRQAILAATGGVLAILTLWENRRKNIQEKEKNDQDHTRQVHAERRARYAKAVEQLADEKAPIRLGGVYTLVKLVDDWLDDEKTLPSEDERRQEGQIIIDSLCAYIRSSFPLAERHDELTHSYEEYQQTYQVKNQSPHSLLKNLQIIPLPKPKNTKTTNTKQSREEFLRDKSIFREEQEVRQTILSEIKKRLNGGEVKREDGKHEIAPGKWSYFEYDFLSTVFFYDVNLNEVNFSGKKISFSSAEFIQQADFSRTTFHEVTDFFGAKFTEIATFFGAKFTEHAYFSIAEFTDQAYFFKATFTEGATFFGAKFTETATFSEAKFTGTIDFSGAEFTRGAYFPGAEFTRGATFSEAKFTGIATFSEAKFTGTTDFSGAEFTWDAYFSEAIFENIPKFEYTLDNKTYKARFSHKADPEGYNFEVSHDSPYKIKTEEQEYNGVKFTIPKGAVLFDPNEPSDLEDDDES